MGINTDNGSSNVVEPMLFLSRFASKVISSILSRKCITSRWLEFTVSNATNWCLCIATTSADIQCSGNDSKCLAAFANRRLDKEWITGEISIVSTRQWNCLYQLQVSFVICDCFAFATQCDVVVRFLTPLSRCFQPGFDVHFDSNISGTSCCFELYTTSLCHYCDFLSIRSPDYTNRSLWHFDFCHWISELYSLQSKTTETTETSIILVARKWAWQRPARVNDVMQLCMNITITSS